MRTPLCLPLGADFDPRRIRSRPSSSQPVPRLALRVAVRVTDSKKEKDPARRASKVSERGPDGPARTSWPRNVPQSFAKGRPRIIEARRGNSTGRGCGLELVREHDRHDTRRYIHVGRIRRRSRHVAVVAFDHPRTFIAVELEGAAVVVFIRIYGWSEIVVVADDLEGAVEEFGPEGVDTWCDVDGSTGCAEMVVVCADSVHGMALIHSKGRTPGPRTGCARNVGEGCLAESDV
jgi:hypothetical protein